MARRSRRKERIETKMTPNGVRLDTFQVARANRLAEIELPTLLGKGVTQKAYANPGIQAPVMQTFETEQAKPVEKKEKAVTRYAEKKTVFEEKRLCKARPTKTKGDGNSRPWVNWCK